MRRLHVIYSGKHIDNFTKATYMCMPLWNRKPFLKENRSIYLWTLSSIEVKKTALFYGAIVFFFCRASILILWAGICSEAEAPLVGRAWTNLLRL